MTLTSLLATVVLSVFASLIDSGLDLVQGLCLALLFVIEVVDCHTAQNLRVNPFMFVPPDRARKTCDLELLRGGAAEVAACLRARHERPGAG